MVAASAGETVVVCDDERPVAWLGPPGPADDLDVIPATQHPSTVRDFRAVASLTPAEVDALLAAP